MEVSWTSAEAWTRVQRAAGMEGKRATVGPICRDCLRLIPRIKDDRWDIAESFCKCGHKTTREADEAAHGIRISSISGGVGNLYE